MTKINNKMSIEINSTGVCLCIPNYETCIDIEIDLAPNECAVLIQELADYIEVISSGYIVKEK